MRRLCEVGTLLVVGSMLGFLIGARERPPLGGTAPLAALGPLGADVDQAKHVKPSGLRPRAKPRPQARNPPSSDAATVPIRKARHETTLWANVRVERMAACSSYLTRSEPLAPKAGSVWQIDSGVLMYTEPIALQMKRFTQRDNLWEAEEEVLWQRFFADARAADCAGGGAQCAVLDIGAAYGYYSILSKLFSPDEVRVHAFNPHPSFMRDLRYNLMLNRFDGAVCLHELAVSDTSSQGALSYSVASGITRTNQGGEHGKNTAKTVKTTTLDDWAPAHAPELIAADQRPAFLLVKIDIEGAGAMALRGAKSLSPFVTHVMMGIHNDEEWEAAKSAFQPPEFEVLDERRRGDATSPNGVFIARRAQGAWKGAGNKGH